MTNTAVKRLRIFVQSGCLAVAFLTAAPALADDLQKAASVPWTSGHAAELYSSFFPTTDKVGSFVRAAVINDQMQDTLDVEFNRPDVLDYALVDLKGDGKLQLVCRLDYSGRGISYDLVAISKAGGRFHVALLDSPGQLSKVSEIVRDLNGDGQKEVVVDEALSVGQDRSTPVAHFEHVYKYQQGEFVLADALFKHYYRNTLLPSLQVQLSAQEAQFKSSQATSPEGMLYERQKLDALRQSVKAVRQFLTIRQ